MHAKQQVDLKLAPGRKKIQKHSPVYSKCLANAIKSSPTLFQLETDYTCLNEHLHTNGLASTEQCTIYRDNAVVNTDLGEKLS